MVMIVGKISGHHETIIVSKKEWEAMEKQLCKTEAKYGVNKKCLL